MDWASKIVIEKEGGKKNTFEPMPKDAIRYICAVRLRMPPSRLPSQTQFGSNCRTLGRDNRSQIAGHTSSLHPQESSWFFLPSWFLVIIFFSLVEILDVEPLSAAVLTMKRDKNDDNNHLGLVQRWPDARAWPLQGISSRFVRRGCHTAKDEQYYQLSETTYRTTYQKELDAH